MSMSRAYARGCSIVVLILSMTLAATAQLAELKEKADGGDTHAQLSLGEVYQYGEYGQSQDYSQAALWYRKAADQGCSTAQYILGYLYESGQVVPQNFTQAAE